MEADCASGRSARSEAVKKNTRPIFYLVNLVSGFAVAAIHCHPRVPMFNGTSATLRGTATSDTFLAAVNLCRQGRDAFGIF